MNSSYSKSFYTFFDNYDLYGHEYVINAMKYTKAKQKKQGKHKLSDHKIY